MRWKEKLSVQVFHRCWVPQTQAGALPITLGDKLHPSPLKRLSQFLDSTFTQAFATFKAHDRRRRHTGFAGEISHSPTERHAGEFALNGQH